MSANQVQTHNHPRWFEATLVGAFVLTVLFVLGWATTAYGGVVVAGRLVS